jgi:hypothetical protein
MHEHSTRFRGSSRRLTSGLICLTLALVAALANRASAIVWAPTTLDWSCATQTNGETLCSLIAQGVAPLGATAPLEATASYRILKGRVLGAGQPLLTNVAKMPCVFVSAGNLRCEALNEVRLGADVSVVYGESPPSSLLTIYTTLPGPLFDWDGDGLLSAEREGLLLQRYLLGFRGNSLIENVQISRDRSAESVQTAIEAGLRNEWFVLAAPSVRPQTFDDAVIFTRCLRGARRTALTANTAATNAAVTDAKCVELVTSQ